MRCTTQQLSAALKAVDVMYISIKLSQSFKLFYFNTLKMQFNYIHFVINFNHITFPAVGMSSFMLTGMYTCSGLICSK